MIPMKRKYLKSSRSQIMAKVICLFSSLSMFYGCSEKSDVHLNFAWKLDEHGNPDFKPENYQDAITQLKIRFPKIIDQNGIDRSESVEQFQQIVRWLPEFAADTDIKRVDWEQIQMLCQTILLLTDTRQSTFFQSDQRNDFEGYVDQLSKLIPQKSALAPQSAK